ncbi:oligosaccharide repeat unit polymerase [Hyunsoonleella flava]|uniref:Oligosaccharide repeat unit polymerase n=1 Tax=Hyunsoonleella flava TaxID=2527939 RepID=A0A4Q9FD40_9FLAO|nr:O-antigen polymerase [Hyunsoonleella flava]TBN00181.1 oligosaccharide repeat unit polymerase [Hyunsoonleella flava]
MSWDIIFIAIIMLALVNKFFDLRNLLNPFVFFYLYQTAFCFIALAYCESWYPWIPISPELRFYIILAYILTFLGAMISRVLFARNGVEYVKINEIEIEKKPSRAFQISGVLIFIAGVVFFLIFTYKTGGVIIFAEDIENDRISRKVGAGLYNLLFLSFLLYGYMIILLLKDKTYFFKILFFLFTAFALVSYGSRAPLLKLLIASFLMITILNSKKLSLKKYLKIGMGLFLFLVAAGAIRSNFEDDRVTFLRLMKFRAGWRPFVNLQNLQKIYDFFPTEHNYLLGESYWIDFKLFFPGSNPNFGTYLKELMNWDFDGGSVTTTFIGLGYLNFGKIAFIVYPLVYGFLFNSVYQILVLKGKIKNISLLFLMFFSIGVSGSVSTGLFGTLINNILFLLLVLVVHLVLKQLMLKRPFKLNLE